MDSIPPRVLDGWIAFAEVEPEAFSQGLTLPTAAGEDQPAVRMMEPDAGFEWLAKRFGG